MKVKIVHPKHPLLKEIIQYFLFIEKSNHDDISQICYPNTNHCLSLMQGSKIHKINDYNYTITESKNNSSYLTGIYQHPISITSTIFYKELCINFNPLGLETLFGKKLSSYIFKNDVLKNLENSNWETLFEIVFCNESIEHIQNEVESFFMANIQEENISKQLHINTIKDLSSIEEISDLMCKSYRSTHRFFKNEFKLTPKDFLLIKKVRTSMDALFENKSITEIAFDLDFSDQSHFIKTFKKYTNQTPSQFRKNAKKVDKTLVWNLQ